jgi:hypothetical protein
MMTALEKPTKAAGTESDPVRLAAKVSERVQIQEVRLLACSCKLSAYDSSDPIHTHLEYEVNTQADENRMTISVMPKFRLRAGSTAQPTDKPAIYMEAIFLLSYGVKSTEGLTAANLQSFGELNGIYNSWPYWREFVQNMIGRMGLPPLTIPVFRVGGPPKEAPAATTLESAD